MSSHKPDFQLIDHTADLGMIIRSKDLKDLFEDAARAMMRIMIRGNPQKKEKATKLSVEGADLPDLMVRWLGEILYLFEGEGKILTDAVIHSISPTQLEASLKTVLFDPNAHEVLCDIKAVTYHQIEVFEKASHWESKIIFDV